MRLWRSTDSAPWSQRGLSLLLAGLAALAILHSFFLPSLTGIALLTLLGWRWLAARNKIGLPPRWLLMALAFSGLAAIFVWFKTLLGAEAGVAVVMWLAGCKTLETRSPRDSAGLNLLGLFLSFSLLLHQQDLIMTAVIIGLTWLFTLTLIADRLPDHLRAGSGKLAGLLLLQALPLMLILFVAFPRLPGPLWKLPDVRPRYVTGVSPTLSPGSVSNLVQSEEIAFRVQFEKRPPTNELYWRGPVMNTFDGRSWVMGPPKVSQVPKTLKGPAIHYESTIEPHAHAWAYPLEQATSIPGDLQYLADGQVVANGPMATRHKYRFTSIGTELTPTDMPSGQLELNGYSNPKTQSWGEELQQRYPKPQDRIQAILQHFSQGGFAYTLQPPTLGPNWIDDFLFKTRLGFCEHYAGSMAFALRAAGVPARVVGGYLGGENNPLGNYLIVRQSDAHAWLEAWIEGKGWMRIDPTGVVAPSRLTDDLAAALPAGEASNLPTLTNPLLLQMRFFWDNGQNKWNQWVISYDEGERLRLLSKLGDSNNVNSTAIALILGTLLISSGLVWWWLMRGRKTISHYPEHLEWQKLERWLTKQQLGQKLGEGPNDFLQRISKLRPDLAADLREFGELYIRLHYGQESSKTALPQLRQLRLKVQATKKD